MRKSYTRFNNLSESTRQDICDYYTKHTASYTCNKFNITLETLYKVLAVLDVKKHNYSESNFLKHMEIDGYVDFTEADELHILELYKSNSATVLEKNYNIKYYYLDYLLSKYSIPKHSGDENRKLTCIATYGVAHHMQSESGKEKFRAAKAQWSEEKRQAVKEKSDATKVARYGDAKYNNRKQAEQTTLARYGVTNPFQSPDIISKMCATKLSKYGDAHYTNREKAKATCLDRYGTETYLASDDAQKRIKEFNQARYGVDYAFQSEDWQKEMLERRVAEFPGNYNNRELARKTCAEKYGVEYYCISDDCRNAGNGYKSKPNELFAQLLANANIPYEREFKLKRYSYDFKINNILVEINPSVTHNSTWGVWTENGVARTYHSDKSKLAKENGYQVIHVWDWADIEKILSILNNNKARVYARKCTVQSIDKKTADSFIADNHLQGPCRGNSYNFGLFFNDELVQVMTFGRSRYNKAYNLELLRLCSKLNVLVVGGAEKLFNYAKKQLGQQSIISYCDDSIFSGTVYERLGFIRTGQTIIKHWYNIKTKQHFTDNYIQSQGFDRIFKTDFGKGISNTDLMLAHGFVEIYDAGQSTYVYS